MELEFIILNIIKENEPIHHTKFVDILFSNNIEYLKTIKAKDSVMNAINNLERKNIIKYSDGFFLLKIDKHIELINKEIVKWVK